jgi:hypothetical protein
MCPIKLLCAGESQCSEMDSAVPTSIPHVFMRSLALPVRPLIAKLSKNPSCCPPERASITNLPTYPITKFGWLKAPDLRIVKISKFQNLLSS